MKIGLIGCGKVGITLFYLLKKNNQIIGVYDINKKNEQRALKLLHIKRNFALNNLCMKSEALFFATPDDQIVNAYKRVKPFIKGKKYLFHFSGLLPAEILPKSKNIYRGSVHPFATFPKIIIPPPRARYFLFIEGDSVARKAAKNIFRQRYFIVRNIDRRQKVNHHLLGVFSSNLMVGLASAIYELAKKINWKEKDFHEVVFPLIEETLDKIKNYRIKNALSGPLERGDIEVIKMHLRTLNNEKKLLRIYKSLSSQILENIVRGKNKREIEELLKQ